MRAQGTRLSRSAQRLLATLAKSEGGRGDLSGHSASQASAAELIAADLAARDGAGRLNITESGRAHLARAALSRDGDIDPFRGQHFDLDHKRIDTPSGAASVTTNEAESPLAWLARRKGRDGQPLIEAVQLLAGERLRAEFTRAQMMPRTTSNWDISSGHSRRDPGASSFSETMVAARQRVRASLESVGPEFSGLLMDVCCFLKGLTDVERERGWPSRSAKVVLQLGLDRLARHYGYATEARGSSRAPVRTWLADGASFAVDGD